MSARTEDLTAFASALAHAKRLHEDVNVMEDSGGGFHVIRLFCVEHWSRYYKTVTEIRMVQLISGRTT